MLLLFAKGGFIMSHFANSLKQLRIERGLTQSALAKELHVTQNAVFNWENEKREPNLDMIRKIAEYFNTSLVYLIDGKEEFKVAPKFTAYDENGNEIKDRPIKFTDASTSIQEEQARKKIYNLFNSIFDEETLSQGREKIAIQLGEILSSYSTLNEIGRKAAVESIKGLCYSNAMTESRLDTIYFNRIRNKIENGEYLTPDEIEWKYAYLEKSLKTIGDDFGIFYTMLNREGQEQAYIKINQALDQIIELSKMPEYQKKPDTPPQE